jgi:hypothetical protein
MVLSPIADDCYVAPFLYPSPFTAIWPGGGPLHMAAAAKIAHLLSFTAFSHELI